MFKALVKIVAFLVMALIMGIVLSGPINLLLYWLFQSLRWLGLPERFLSLSALRLTGRFEFIATHFSLVPALLIASLVMTRRLEHRPLASLGLSLHPRWFKEFALGLLLASVAAIPILILLHFLAPYIYRRNVTLVQDLSTYLSTPTDWFTVGIVLAMLILFGALFEELIVRGYPFQTLMAAIGQWPTILVTSTIFAVLHYQTHDVSGMVATGILGWIMALLYFRSRSLWVAVGFHAGINGLYSVSVVLGLIFFTREVGENWLHPGMVGVMALILSLWALKYLKPSAEMEALWQQYVPIAQPWAQLRAWWARRKNKSEDAS